MFQAVEKFHKKGRNVVAFLAIVGHIHVLDSLNQQAAPTFAPLSHPFYFIYLFYPNLSSSMAAPAKNYREMLTGMTDLHEPNYAPFYTPFGADINQLAPANLRAAVIDASNTYPKVFVKATIVNNAVEISCLLRPTKYRAPLGVTSRHEGHYHCLNGDLSGQGLPSVALWPAQSFQRCTPTTIYTVDEVNAQLLAAPGLQFFPTLLANAARNKDSAASFVRFR